MSKHSPEINYVTKEELQSKSRFNVMVVDDDLNTVDVFSEYLELTDHKVVGKAFDGKQAFEMFKQVRPDFVFLDIMMPEYDGFYALEKIKQYDRTAFVIAVTADLSNETEDKLHRLYVDSIVYKPFDMDNILSIMESLYKKKSLQYVANEVAGAVEN
ncbi:response regulator receiver protein [Candidatus Nitrosopumilus koreensis AR1]|uniref:Response regulator receiver protein n=1 Tax=Candidatus Nitrosopumilus koreensis AR1 TaxID=1229908 RepID=K0B7D4_9ARCH|nr:MULTISPECIES: response regulator [Nitrosopumilus]AFS81072.1 response regulator receiver protein [Candidatus Nitrosopumilus koreensis AR1]